MIAAGSRLRQIGWVVILAICLAGFVALTFRVNAVKSEVRLAERRIIQLEREKLLLETEVETRANQQQLASWNALEVGYEAPRADQYRESERQLAALGTPRAIGAPSPIRVARAPDAGEAGAPAAMVSPITGKPVSPREDDADDAGDMAPLAERLAMPQIGQALAEVQQ